MSSRKERRKRKRRMKARLKERAEKKKENMNCIQVHRKESNEILSFQEHKCIVVCSDEKNIMIFHSETGDFVASIPTIDYCMRNMRGVIENYTMMKFDDDHLICVSKGDLCCFNMKDISKVCTFPRRNQNSQNKSFRFYNFVKLDADLFVVVDMFVYDDHDVYSFSERKIVRSLRSHFGTFAIIHKSKLREEILYFCHRDWRNANEIFVVDWKKDEVIQKVDISSSQIKTLENHEVLLTTYMYEDVEYLVLANCERRRIYFYDTRTYEVIKIIEEGGSSGRKKGDFRSLFIIRNDYVVTGNDVGDLSFFRLEHLERYNIISDAQRHSINQNGEITLISMMDHDKFSCRLVVGIFQRERSSGKDIGGSRRKYSSRAYIAIVKVPNLRLPLYNEGEMLKMDFNDRFEFLNNMLSNDDDEEEQSTCLDIHKFCLDFKESGKNVFVFKWLI